MDVICSAVDEDTGLYQKHALRNVTASSTGAVMSHVNNVRWNMKNMFVYDGLSPKLHLLLLQELDCASAVAEK